jgi:hypothetical protein
MKIMTWDKNEIKVDVNITGKSDNSDQRAQEIVDRITITDSKSGNTVSFKTNFADEHKNNDKRDRDENHNEGMEVNWSVYLPAGNALTAENQFGKMIVPDIRGEANLTSKFGSLTAGKISNARSITVEFGSADIAQMNGGELTIKFSSGTVKKLGGDINSDLEFSQVKLELDNDLKSIQIDNSYSTVYLDLDRSFSANYDISTSHGEFTNNTAFAIKRQGNDDDNRYGPRFNNRYSGTSGGGAAKVRVNSSFGEIIAGHDLNPDLTDKHKGNKNRTRSI